jgi:hypothetical protein
MFGKRPVLSAVLSALPLGGVGSAVKADTYTLRIAADQISPNRN